MSIVIKGKGSAEVREIAIKLKSENDALKKKVQLLESRNESLKVKTCKVQTKVKIKTKTENLPEYRKRKIGKVYARSAINDKIKASFNTRVSDMSKVLLITADFCTEFKLSQRQLGILLYSSNFRQVRKKDLHDGRDVGAWYAQTIEAMFTKQLILRTNNEMIKWVFFTLTSKGERLVRMYEDRVKEFVHE